MPTNEEMLVRAFQEKVMSANDLINFGIKQFQKWPELCYIYLT